MKLIERKIDETWDDDVQAFQRNLEQVENSALVAALVSLSNDAAWYRRNPFRLVESCLLTVYQSADFDEERHYHLANYVFERTELSNVEPQRVLFTITAEPSNEEGVPRVDVSNLVVLNEGTSIEDVNDDYGEVLLEKAYSPQGEAILEQRRDSLREAQPEGPLTQA